MAQAGDWGLTSSSPTSIRGGGPALLGWETTPLQPPHASVLPAPCREVLEVSGACNRGATERSWGLPPALGVPAGGRTPPCQLPLTAVLLILAPLTLLLEVTQLLRGDAQVTAGEMALLTETLGLPASQLSTGGPEPWRWAGHVGGAEQNGGQGVGGPVLAWGGRDSAGSPRAGLQLSDRMRSSRPTTAPGPVCPARRI